MTEGFGPTVTTVDDDGRGIAVLMRLFGSSAIRFRMVERSRFQTFAARLLPGLSFPIPVTELRSEPLGAVNGKDGKRGR
jgi:hypothetical protein